ncbi:hypothetical protein OG285_06080 [Streptomyces sp. NBC_01471]|uniref:hypothetical protein n=1 Tax=Streptomyces sp. NBC_01471 TaxID=2903879 RepID=UPI0032535324
MGGGEVAHHAVLDADDKITTAISRLLGTHSGDYAYYVDIAHFMAGRPLDGSSPARWLDGEPVARQRWRELVITRRDRCNSTL